MGIDWGRGHVYSSPVPNIRFGPFTFACIVLGVEAFNSSSLWIVDWVL